MCFFFFFFKQKTAYEMRISDWSSDVCSSDLHADLLGADEALAGLDALDPAVGDAEARHLAVLDDVDAAGIGAAGEAPGDRVVARGAAAPLQRGDRKSVV